MVGIASGSRSSGTPVATTPGGHAVLAVWKRRRPGGGAAGQSKITVNTGGCSVWRSCSSAFVGSEPPGQNIATSVYGRASTTRRPSNLGDQRVSHDSPGPSPAWLVSAVHRAHGRNRRDHRGGAHP